MSEIPHEQEFYRIIREAVSSMGVNTNLDRQRTYEFARNFLRDSVKLEGSHNDSNRASRLDDLERAIQRVETEEQAQQRKISDKQSLPRPSNRNETGNEFVHQPKIDFTMHSPPPERTTLFLRNIGAGGAVSIIKILIQLALLPLMAHLLGPKEFGVYALAVPVVAFLVVIADGGVGLSLARDRTNAAELWSTAFWVLLASSFVISILVIASGYVLAEASSEPQLKIVMVILAMSFPFLALAVLPIARLARRGNLVASAVADLVATIAGALCAVGLGIIGFGAKSLAFQFLIGYIIRAIILNIYAFERPRAVFHPAAMRAHLSSGGILMGGRITDLACRSGETLLFGNAFGAASLGAYNFANQVPRFLFEAFSNPTWSALYAQSLSEQHDYLLQIYYKVCKLMAFVTFPMAAVLLAASPEILKFILGPTWEQAGVFLQILAPGYAVSISASMATALLLAMNANIAFFLTTLLLGSGRVLAISMGSFLPAFATVWLVTLSNVLYAAVTCSFAVKFAQAEFTFVLREVFSAFIASVSAGLACWVILRLCGGSGGALSLAIFAAAICYFGVMFAIERNNLLKEYAFLKSAMGGIITKSP